MSATPLPLDRRRDGRPRAHRAPSPPVRDRAWGGIETLGGSVTLTSRSIRALVAPRVLGLMLALPLLNLVGLVFAALAGVVVELADGGTTVGYLASFQAGFSSVDVFANVLKTTAFGFLVAIVCCYRGLN